MHNNQQEKLSKVPEITLAFWLIKIIATTLGETGGDAVTMSMGLGYATGSVIFFGIFVVAVAGQILSASFLPLLYWTTIVATTTVGTTMADFVDRSLDIGYAGGSALLVVLLAATLGLWRWSERSVAVETVATPRTEMFYWGTILFSQTLGTALGDWMADTNGTGYEIGALLFGLALGLVALVWFCTGVSRTLLFWCAFILTRPLGATLGDLLDKPLADGGLAFDRYVASAVLIVLILVLVLALPHRASRHPAAPAEPPGG